MAATRTGVAAATPTIDLLLSTLERVKRSGTGWRADCPNGHTNTRGSLSLGEAEDGRILLHCFACGDVAGILRTLDLQTADLFPGKLKDPSPEARHSAREAFKRSAWTAALGVLDREAAIVQAAARNLLAGLLLDDPDRERLVLATDRIRQAREVLA